MHILKTHTLICFIYVCLKSECGIWKSASITRPWAIFWNIVIYLEYNTSTILINWASVTDYQPPLCCIIYSYTKNQCVLNWQVSSQWQHRGGIVLTARIQTTLSPPPTNTTLLEFFLYHTLVATDDRLYLTGLFVLKRQHHDVTACCFRR